MRRYHRRSTITPYATHSRPAPPTPTSATRTTFDTVATGKDIGHWIVMAGNDGTLKERLAAEMRAAMKAQDKVRLGALRLLTASVKNREVELRHELSDDEFVEVALREAKRRQE